MHGSSGLWRSSRIAGEGRWEGSVHNSIVIHFSSWFSGLLVFPVTQGGQHGPVRRSGSWPARLGPARSWPIEKIGRSELSKPARQSFGPVRALTEPTERTDEHELWHGESMAGACQDAAGAWRGLAKGIAGAWRGRGEVVAGAWRACGQSCVAGARWACRPCAGLRRRRSSARPSASLTLESMSTEIGRAHV